MPTTCQYYYCSDCCRAFPIFVAHVLFAQRRFSFAQGILSFAHGNSQSSQRSLGDDRLVWIPARVYCLIVCKTNYVFNVKNLPLAPQYRKRLLKISVNSVRNIHNHAKVEKTSATCNNKRRLTWFVGNPHVFWGLKHGMGG